MRLIGLAVILTVSLTLAPLAVEAEQAGRTATIGYLGNSSPTLESNLVQAFREGLRRLGYVEGQNLVIKYVWAEDSRNAMRSSHESLSVSDQPSSSPPAPRAPLRLSSSSWS